MAKPTAASNHAEIEMLRSENAELRTQLEKVQRQVRSIFATLDAHTKDLAASHKPRPRMESQRNADGTTAAAALIRQRRAEREAVEH